MGWLSIVHVKNPLALLPKGYVAQSSSRGLHSNPITGMHRVAHPTVGINSHLAKELPRLDQFRNFLITVWLSPPEAESIRDILAKS